MVMHYSITIYHISYHIISYIISYIIYHIILQELTQKLTPAKNINMVFTLQTGFKKWQKISKGASSTKETKATVESDL